MKKTLVNGQVSNSVSINNRGLCFGDGLFETIKVSDGTPEFLTLHLLRLARGCQRLAINADLSAIRQDIETVLSGSGWPQAVLKIQVTRAYNKRGYKPDDQAGSDRIISLASYAGDGKQKQVEGVAIRLCDMRLGINPALAGMKHLARLENVLARAEWGDPLIAEGLLLDTAGRVIEGTMSNLFVIYNRQLYTPSLHRCGVEGVIRQVIIDKLVQSLGFSCVIQDLTLDDILQADEMFLCNSLIGIWPVISLGCHKKNIGPITVQLQRALLAESRCDD